jgi:hypothetical protein
MPSLAKKVGGFEVIRQYNKIKYGDLRKILEACLEGDSSYHLLMCYLLGKKKIKRCILPAQDRPNI